MCFVVVNNKYDIRTVSISESSDNSEFYREFETTEQAEEFLDNMTRTLNDAKKAKLQVLQQLINIENQVQQVLNQNMTKVEDEEIKDIPNDMDTNATQS